MFNHYILTTTIFVPAAGAFIVALLPRNDRVIRWWTLFVTLVTLALTLVPAIEFNYSQPGFQFVENHPWIAHPAIRYHLGIDGLSMWLTVLTGVLSVVGVLVSWRAIATRTKEYYFYFLLQQTAMLGIFMSLDLLLFYSFWELSLIPMSILIAMFGIERGPKTALKFFLYTFLSSALFLVAILWLYGETGTFEYTALQHIIASGTNAAFTSTALMWASLAFLVAFAVKVPVFPLHGWLSDCIHDAPTAMAMVIAGKLGLYSILRFNLGLFPTQAREAAPVLVILAVIGILYGASIAIIQTDMKRLIAYSILSAVGFCTLGIFCFSVRGLDGAVYQFINEGITGAAFLSCTAFLYERYGTYDIARYRGTASKLPILATLFVLTGFSVLALPLFNTFVGEFLILSGSFPAHHGWVTAATVCVILTASYMLYMILRIFYGPPSKMVTEHGAPDLCGREHALLWPLAIIMIVMGVASPFWMRGIEKGVTTLANPAPHTISMMVTR